MLSRRFYLGAYFGIPLYVHWTFLLLLLFVGFSPAIGGEAWGSPMLRVSLVLMLYVCVTLHEYGHALMARAFNVGTRDITLLPIGGVARLEKMPRIPWQELMVALAGPLVNVVIAAMLGVVLFIGEGAAMISDTVLVDDFDADEKQTLGFLGVVWTLLAANLLLVVFNMIPAFPMDGGRVLRSVLAMVFSYRTATWWASRLGWCVAGLMGVAAFSFHLYGVLIIACFIAWAGWVEAKQVEITEALRTLRVADAMINRRDLAVAYGGQDLAEAAAMLVSRRQSLMPILDRDDALLGVVHREDLLSWMRAGQDSVPIIALATQDVPTITPEQDIESVLAQMPNFRGRHLPVVSREGLFVGLLDLQLLLREATLP